MNKRRIVQTAVALAGAIVVLAAALAGRDLDKKSVDAMVGPLTDVVCALADCDVPNEVTEVAK